MPDGLETGTVVDAVRRGWHVDAGWAEFAPVGAGSYHWRLADAFVTVDDLGQKAWLGDTYDEAFAGLRRAFDAAVALRAAGLDFVVAPLPSRDGESLRRIDARYTIAVFPLVDGKGAAWGPYEDEAERSAVAALLSELHAAPADAATAGFEVPGRVHLEAALRELDEPWSGGPLSEPAREAIRARASELAEELAEADRLAAAAVKRPFVVTHGEPHRANVLRTRGGYVLVDWDTVALGPPERDLWMLDPVGREAADVYVAATGREIDEAALEFFRLTWDLKDIAEYLQVLRGPHTENEDTLRQLNSL